MTYADVLATTTKTKLDDVTRHRNRFCKPTFFISAFFAIPVWQFIYYIWASMTDSGNHDICYYNELCRAKMHVSDFNHLLSNLLYAFFGIAFMIIVYCRKRSFLGSGQYVVCGRGLLIPWGAYFAMGLSLVMEGVLSGAYHLCPSRSTFQFDVAFMYVIAVLLLSTMHQIRFRAIPSGTKPFILLTILTLVSLVFTLIEHWGSESHAYYARIIFCICHIVFAVFYCLGLFYHGTLKIVKKEETATDPNRSNETQTQAQMIPNQEEEWYTGFYWAFYHLWFPLSRTWIYRKVFRNQGSHVPKTLKIAHNPQTGLDKPFWVWRFIWCLVLFLVNAIMSILLTRNAARFSNYLLFILLTNVGASLLIYVFWKFFYWNRERKSQEEQDPDKPANWPFTVQTCLYFLVAAVTGVYAFIKFRSNVTEWSKTAAESRVLNKPCLELWKHYDQHDVWHFFSAVALFFSFLGQLTLDDGLIMKERNKIHVF